MLDACPVHPKGTMVIPMLWRISGYVVCMMGVKNKNHHTHPYPRLFVDTFTEPRRRVSLLSSPTPWCLLFQPQWCARPSTPFPVVVPTPD